MGDDLEFPPGPDDLTFPDFGDDIRASDPMIPTPEFHIPQIYPPGNAQPHNFNTMSNNVSNINSSDSTYQPINQLMKQTQQLASTLASPLNSNLNFRNQTDPSLQARQQQLLSSNISNQINNTSLTGFANQQQQVQQPQQQQNSPKNSQFFRRIQIPIPSQTTQQQQRTILQQQQTQQQLTQQQQLHSQLLPQQQIQQQQQQQQQPQIANNTSILNIQSSNSLVGSLTPTFNTQHLNAILNRTSQAPQSVHQQTVRQVLTTQSALNIQGSAPNNVTNKFSTTQNTMNALTHGNATKPSVVVKVPQTNQGIQIVPQLKGSIIKTQDQQLMFVVDDNGKKVGYMIKQGKQVQSQSQSSPQTVTNVPSPIQNTPSPGASSPSVPSPNLPSSGVPSPNFSVDSMHSPSSNNSSDVTVNSKLSHGSNSQDVDLHRIKAQSQNIPITNIQDIDISKLKAKADLDKKPESITERLLVFGTTLKNAGKMSSAISKNSMSRITHVNPVSIELDHPVSKIISDFDKALPDSDNNINTNVGQKDGAKSSMSAGSSTENCIVIDEEEGQEIEFSEKDLTTDAHEDSDDTTVMTAVKVPRDSPEMIELNNEGDNNEDEVPLAFFKNESFSENIPIVCEKSSDSKSRTKTSKPEYERETSDSIPLSIVAATLKKSTTTEQASPTGNKPKKKRTRKKKKDADEPVKPLLAYQVFFKERQAELKEENPTYKENFGLLSKTIGHLWETLDPVKKKEYQDVHTKAKAEYNIQLKEYNERKAKEAELAGGSSVMSPLSVDENSRDNVSDDDDDEDAPLKKTAKKKMTSPTTSKKAQTQRKKLTATTIATTTTISPLLENINKAEDDSNQSMPSPQQPQPMEIVDGRQTTTKTRSTRNTRSKRITTSTSPSPPSTDTNTSDEDDEDDKISRIRMLAAKASKKIQYFGKKTKGGKANTRRGSRVTKMEVETVSEKVVIEHAPPPVFDVKEPAQSTLLTQSSSPMYLTSSSQSQQSGSIQQQQQQQQQEATSIPFSNHQENVAQKLPSPTSSSKQKTSKLKDKVKQEKNTAKTTIATTNTTEKAPKANEKQNKKLEKAKEDSSSTVAAENPKDDVIVPPTSTAPTKTTFKIPKRTNTENGQVVPQGPRLCIREHCDNPVRVTRERGGYYCSNGCLVIHCRDSFDLWVTNRKIEET